MMKKSTLFFLSLLLAGVPALTQTPAQAREFLYYHRYASAETALHESIRQEPANGESWLLLTKSYLIQNKLQKAVDSLKLAPASLNEDPFFLIAKGAILLYNKKIDSAHFYFDKAIDDTKGKNAAVLSAAADMEIRSGNGDMNYALSLIEKAKKRDKNNASLYVLEGNAFRNLHNGGEAYRSYMSAIQKNKNHAEAYYLLGDIFKSQKNQELYTENFLKAIQADKNYAPAYYELYNHYVYTKPDVQKAMQYFKQYEALSDKTIQHDYMYTDLLYLTGEYAKAISNAKELINREGNQVQARLYKLIAYSYAELKDSLLALNYMRNYFDREIDSNLIAKDFETMANLYFSKSDNDSAIVFYQKAAAVSKDSTTLFNSYKNLANLTSAKKDYAAQSKWLGFYYQGNTNASNVDLFNWGIAAYRSGNYVLADSVFGLYTTQYPEQGFGYYWRARSNAAIDTAMAEGRAIPYYTKLVETIAGDSIEIAKDSLSSSDKKWIIEAYSYMAVYNANTLKEYDDAIEYFDRILEIDPENVNAKKYIPILEENVKKETENN